MPRSSVITLLDVAKRVGLGKTTVSDALSGSGRVSPETRELVLAAAKELGYVPNAAARHLRRSTTGTIGLHLPETLTRSDYYMTFVFGVVDEATRHDYDVTLITGAGRTNRLPRVDGLVLTDPASGDPYTTMLLESSLPTVTGERVTAGPAPDGVVRSNHEAAMTELLDHLAAAGARRPALIVAGDDVDWSASVARGFTAWCADHDREPLMERIDFESRLVQLNAAASRLLDDHPDIDALICAPDASAATLLPLLSRRGRVVGEDLLLACGVDGPTNWMAQPPITAIDLKPREAGVMCGQLLFDLLSGTETDAEMILPVELIKRDSTRKLR